MSGGATVDGSRHYFYADVLVGSAVAVPGHALLARQGSEAS